ncbi:MAG: hypothetical protein HONBIEJF_01490 [Fimbriimonadaceae bacterium]|nr:hypothetical protein [Fimbriimonadaceae bacterium]
MMELKHISPDAVPHALELAHRYRLLNEPEQAASICHDILATDPENVDARRTLFLALTDQFGLGSGVRFEEAEAVASAMASDYERLYHRGMACERWGRAQLNKGAAGTMVRGWLQRAMERYAEAEAVRPAGNDDAILRWNACVRTLKRLPEHADSDSPGLWD